MASTQEKLADSLSKLKEFQEKNGHSIIKGLSVFGETHTKRLLQNGYLEQIIRGWYMPSMPGLEGDSTTWYASYWHFISAYTVGSEMIGVSLLRNLWIIMPVKQLFLRN